MLYIKKEWSSVEMQGTIIYRYYFLRVNTINDTLIINKKIKIKEAIFRGELIFKISITE